MESIIEESDENIYLTGVYKSLEILMVSLSFFAIFAIFLLYFNLQATKNFGFRLILYFLGSSLIMILANTISLIKPDIDCNFNGGMRMFSLYSNCFFSCYLSVSVYQSTMISALPAKRHEGFFVFLFIGLSTLLSVG